jgi:hypothetical protein
MLKYFKKTIACISSCSTCSQSRFKENRLFKRIDRIDPRLSPAVHRSFVRFNSMFLSNLHWKMITIYIVVTPTQAVRHVTPATLN